jgi:hypothetical protein
LNELATELGAALGHYVAFADRTWILDAGRHSRHRQIQDRRLLDADRE